MTRPLAAAFAVAHQLLVAWLRYSARTAFRVYTGQKERFTRIDISHSHYDLAVHYEGFDWRVAGSAFFEEIVCVKILL